MNPHMHGTEKLDRVCGLLHWKDERAILWDLTEHPFKDLVVDTDIRWKNFVQKGTCKGTNIDAGWC